MSEPPVYLTANDVGALIRAAIDAERKRIIKALGNAMYGSDAGVYALRRLRDELERISKR